MIASCESIFVVASENMDVQPNQCLMVEDAIVGVEAGRNGRFALVIGIARNGEKQALLTHGADIVVKDLEELSFRDIDKWFKEGIYKDSWHLTSDISNPI